MTTKLGVSNVLRIVSFACLEKPGQDTVHHNHSHSYYISCCSKAISTFQLEISCIYCIYTELIAILSLFLRIST